MTQLKRDSDFLRAIGVMDYSLLLGINFSTSRCGHYHMKSGQTLKSFHNHFGPHHLQEVTG